MSAPAFPPSLSFAVGLPTCLGLAVGEKPHPSASGAPVAPLPSGYERAPEWGCDRVELPNAVNMAPAPFRRDLGAPAAAWQDERRGTQPPAVAWYDERRGESASRCKNTGVSTWRMTVPLGCQQVRP